MNSLKKLAGQTAVYGVSSILGRMLNYLLVPLYTRVFTTEQYGVVTEMYAYVAFLIIILTYGMETAFFRFSSASDNKNKVYSTALISLITTSLLFICLAAIFSQPIANWLRYPNHTEYVTWFAIIVGLDALSAIPLARLRELGKAKLFATVNIISIFVNIGLNLFFLVYCRHIYEVHGENSNWLVQSFYNHEIGVGYVFISNLVASIVKAALLSPYMVNIRLSFSVPLVKKMLWYSSPLLIAGLAGIVNEAIDRIMIKRLLMDVMGEKATLELLGIYGACYKVSIIIAIFIQAFRFAAEPFFFAQQKEENAQKTYADVMKYFVIICSFIFLGIMMYIDVVMLFVGKDFREGVTVVPILLLANLCLGIYFNLSIWYKLTGKTRYGAYIAIFGAIITLVLNYIWIPSIGYFGGYIGPAWATLICYFSMMIVSYFLGKKHFPVNYDLKRIIGYTGLAIGLYFISTYINMGLQGYSILINTLILLIFVSVVFFVERGGKFKISV
ncbi:MAG: oligosaccharide flippase family protein [Bacteroidota bacterium]